MESSTLKWGVCSIEKQLQTQNNLMTTFFSLLHLNNLLKKVDDDIYYPSFKIVSSGAHYHFLLCDNTSGPPTSHLINNLPPTKILSFHSSSSVGVEAPIVFPWNNSIHYCILIVINTAY